MVEILGAVSGGRFRSCEVEEPPTPCGGSSGLVLRDLHSWPWDGNVQGFSPSGKDIPSQHPEALEQHLSFGGAGLRGTG